MRGALHFAFHLRSARRYRPLKYMDVSPDGAQHGSKVESKTCCGQYKPMYSGGHFAGHRSGVDFDSKVWKVGVTLLLRRPFRPQKLGTELVCPLLLRRCGKSDLSSVLRVGFYCKPLSHLTSRKRLRLRSPCASGCPYKRRASFDVLFLPWHGTFKKQKVTRISHRRSCDAQLHPDSCAWRGAVQQ